MPELCAKLKEIGIVGVDLANDRADWPILKEHGLAATMVPGAGTIENGLNNAARRGELLAEFRGNIAAAAEFGWKRVITFAGGRENIGDAEGMAVCAATLKEAVKIADDFDVEICVELLNSKVDHPGYMADSTAWGAELCKRVESPRVKLLYDIYHMQIMEGDIIRTIRGNIDFIGHFHTAGNPGRKDLDEEQELYYPPIIRAIAQLQAEGKFDGYVAHEFVPKNGFDSLRKAFELCAARV
jgi:Hydroxypyruvate isomerase